MHEYIDVWRACAHRNVLREIIGESINSRRRIFRRGFR